MPAGIIDLREWASPVEEQWQLGSCTAQAVIGAYELLTKMHYPDQAVDLSRLFLYYNARKIAGDIEEDVGAYVSTALTAIELYGLCREDLWPYDAEQFKVEPGYKCYRDAKKRSVANVHEVTSHDMIIDMLNQQYPVVVGVAVYSGFDSIDNQATTLKMPMTAEEPIGSHAMCIVGYNDARQAFLLRNSFGDDWGEGGYFWVPFVYADENFSDMWTFDVKLNGINN
jgi:C1A family cysteine protease